MHYSFPTLRIPDIVSCLDELLQPQVPFQDDDLLNPNPKRIIPLYESLVELFMGVVVGGEKSAAATGGGAMDFACAEILEYPDLHVEALNLISLFKHVHKLMTEVGIDDFCLRDIIKPDPARLRKIMSGVINFAKFREEKFNLFENLAKRSDEVQAAYIDEQAKNDDFLDKLTSLKLQRTEQEPEVRKYEQLNSELKENLIKLNEEQKVVTLAVESLKKERNELKENITNIVYAIEKGKQEAERLRAGIVKNPEKLKNTITMMNNDVLSSKQNIQELENQARKLQNKLDVMTHVDQDIEMNIKIMEDIAAERKALEGEKFKLIRSKETLESRQNELRELGVKEQQLKRQCNTAEERLKRLQQQISVKQGNIDQKVEELHKVYDILSEEREQVAAQLDENQNAINLMESQIVDVCKKMEVNDTDIQRDIRSLTDKMESYHNVVVSQLRLRAQLEQ